MAKHPFHAHHAAAKKAFDAGDHDKAARHIGHLFAANQAARRGKTSTHPEPDADDTGVQHSASITAGYTLAVPEQKPGFNMARFRAMRPK